MNNQLIYYKLISEFPEDRTKNCGLEGIELDTNFYNLKKYDIKTGYWSDENNNLVLERIGNEDPIVIDFPITLPYKFNYDKENGILTITKGDEVILLEGFITEQIVKDISSSLIKPTFTDYTLKGDGTLTSPLYLSELVKTGTFRPVINIVDTIKGDTLPAIDNLVKDDRFVTYEKVSKFGLLYNYLDGVKQIEEDLLEQKSEWRIPSKNDWDNMLNAIELCDEDKNHAKTETGIELGKVAGKLLKSEKYWKNIAEKDELGPVYFGVLPVSQNDISVDDITSMQSSKYIKEVNILDYFIPSIPIDRLNDIEDEEEVERLMEDVAYNLIVAYKTNLPSFEMLTILDQIDDKFTPFKTLNIKGEEYTILVRTDKKTQRNVFDNREIPPKSIAVTYKMKIKNFCEVNTFDEDIDINDDTTLTLGIDSYGFTALPCGRADAEATTLMSYFSERGIYWANTIIDVTGEHYVKRLDYNKNSIIQESINNNEFVSLRLVKDYSGHNFKQYELINGVIYKCVIMPSEDGVLKIWTAENINFTDEKYKGLLPNNGLNIQFYEKYFVNEWNGIEWLKQELFEGESLVVFNSENNRKNLEYRIVDGKLTCVNDLLYIELLETLTPLYKILSDRITKETDRAIKAEQGLDDKINKEIDRAVTTEQTLDVKINKEIDRAIKTEQALDTKINNEINRAVNSEQVLDDKINTETVRAIKAEQGLDDKINTETVRAINTEQELDTKINAEIVRAIDAEQGLDDKINSEIDRSVTTDQKLDNKINDEIDRAVATEQGLDDKINKEIDRSLTTDQTLDTKINSEIDRSVTTDQNLDDKINVETVRAITTEQGLDTKINSETVRAIKTEQGLDDKINAETVRAITTEQGLDDKINTEIQNRFNNDIDSKITYMLKVNEGLILKTNDNTNIVIKIDDSYGEY